MPTRSASQRHRRPQLGTYLVDVQGLPHRGTRYETYDYDFIPARSHGEAKRYFESQYVEMFQHRPKRVRAHRLTDREEERFEAAMVKALEKVKR
jgi:hypothetical protein